MNGDAAEVCPVVTRHVPAETKTELLTSGSAEVSVAADRGLAIPGHRRLKPDQQEVIAPCGARVHPAFSRPAGYGMEMSSEVKVPRRQEDKEQVQQHAAAQ